MTSNSSLLREYGFRLDVWRGNFWFLPLVIGVASVATFVSVVWLDRRIDEGLVPIRQFPFWFGGTPQASRDLMGTISSTVGTITTVVFSISILALQLASSEYTPKLLRSFTKSTVSQLTLGLFIATVAFSILTLSVIREDTPGQKPFVPDIAVNVSKLLTLTSLGFLVYFIGHIAVLISPSHIIRCGIRDTLSAYNAFIEEKVGEDAPPVTPSDGGITTVVSTEESGYLQQIRTANLVQLSSTLSTNATTGLTARVAVGDQVKRGNTLAEIHAGRALSEDEVKKARAAFVLGHNRLPETDFRYGIDEFYSIASRRIKQLDSDTAIECVNALIEVWLEMMSKPLYPPNRWITVRESQVHLALVPVDTDGQLTEVLRRLQEYSMGKEMLLDVASAVHDGLATVARESALQGYESTFEKCWSALIWSTTQIIRATDDEGILRRVHRSLASLKPVLCETLPQYWEKMVSEVRESASGRKSEAFRELLISGCA